MATKNIIIPNNLSDNYFDKGINTINKIEYKLQYTLASLKASAVSPSLVYITDITKQGLFRYDSTDTITAGDDLNVIVDNTGKRWKRTADITKANLASPTFTGTVSGITSTMVGLGNVDNSSDLNKPISTAQQTAFNNKLETVTSIVNLQAFTLSSFAYFDGSIWERKAGNVASNGGLAPGTIVNVSSSFYWERKSENYVNVKWFGAKGDNSTNDTLAINNAITYVGSLNSDRSGTLFIPKGTYKANIVIDYKKVSLIGEGENTTILTPFDNTKPVLILGKDASWNRMSVKDITFKGIDLTSIGIQFGNVPFVETDQYSGRTNIENCKFITFDKCISRTAGNIAIYINNCTFANANYHHWGQPSPALDMQVGVTEIKNSHFESANLASIFIKGGVLGDGQFIFNNCVWEQNTGFILFINTYADVSIVPEIVFENCWNEANHSATSVVINSITYTPQFAYLKNVSNISFINSPITSITLISSNCYLDRTDISGLVVTKDNESVLNIDNALMHSSKTQEFVKSIKSSTSQGNFSSYFSSFHRNILNDTNLSNVKLSIPFNTTYLFVGSTSRNTVSVANDGTTYNNCESLLINQSETLVSNTNATISANKFYVYSLSYKLISGLAPTVSITEEYTIASNISLMKTSWTTVCGVVSTFGVTGLPNTARMYVTPGASGSSTVYLGGFQLLEFSNQQDAITFLESKTFTGSKTFLDTKLPTTNISGTTNYVSKFTGTNSLGNSQIFDNGTNVGIGTISPQTPLDVNGIISVTGSAPYIQWKNTSNVRLGYIQHNATDLAITSDVGNITFNSPTVQQIMTIRSTGNVGIGTATNAGYKLDVNGTLRSENSAYFATTSGNVGIGTTAPTSKLHVISETNNIALFRDNSTASVFEIKGSATQTIFEFSNRPLQIVFQGVPFLTTSLSGNIGINTAVNAGYKLDVNGTLRSANDAYFATTSGNVGIGTTSPNAKLTLGLSIINDLKVWANSDLAGIDYYAGINYPQTNFYGRVLDINAGSGNSNGGSVIRFLTADGNAAGTTRLFIKNDGKVGIGTTAPTSILQVVGLPVYSDNTAATAGGLTAGAFYRTSTGILMVAF